MKIILTKEQFLKLHKDKNLGLRCLKDINSLLPLRASPELAGLIADLMGDGHLQAFPKSRLDYTSNSKEELERFGRVVTELFNCAGTIRKCSTNTYGTMNYGVNNRLCALILEAIGVPAGAKVFKKFSIPNWILEDNNCFGRFINRLFSCEGCVDVPSRAIELKMYKEESLVEEGIKFFESIRASLDKHFSITTSRPFLTKPLTRKDGKRTVGIRIKIKRKESLRNYLDKVGFDDKAKRNKLEILVQSFKASQ